ncbi:MAG: hypothetical protein JSR59_22765 [Proteobacteria bacterium]|nr:hypothetical protein [Pseudomonadota bacterium]
MDQDDLDYRQQLARRLLSQGIGPNDLDNRAAPLTRDALAAAPRLAIAFPDGTRPTPVPITPVPALDAPLPAADVVVVTWTVDETTALSDVMTPGITRDHWIRYAHHYADYLPKIRPGAPARAAQRLGSYCLTTIGTKRVLCFKSELHLNQDGVVHPPLGAPGNATLPVKDLFHQIIDETGASLVITTGTAGAVYSGQDLGDVVVTRGARFRVQQEFRNAPFRDQRYRSDWEVPTTHFHAAIEIMRGFKAQVAQPDFGPPTASYRPAEATLPTPRPSNPDIRLDGRDMPAFHPILTTDYFEFGTSSNHLDHAGCAVEMGDAVLGLAVQERAADGRSAPRWLVIRNCSDPQINGALRDTPAKQSVQAMWAVYFYTGFGYWTTVNSALATWAVIAGL